MLPCRGDSRSRRLALVAAPLVAAIVASAVTPAHALPKKPAAAKAQRAAAPKTLGESLTGQASADYIAGRALFAAGDAAGALTKFEAAYLASKDPRLLWNMAACEKARKRYASATLMLEHYKSEGATTLAAADLARADQLLATFASNVGAIVVAAGEGAQVAIDGEDVGTSPLAGPVRVDRGSRKVTVTRAGFVPWSAIVNVTSATPIAVEVALVPEVHEGRLVVDARPGDAIEVDGKRVGEGKWEAAVATGVHEVRVTAPEKKPLVRSVTIDDGKTFALDVVLEAEPPPAAASEPAPAEALAETPPPPVAREESGGLGTAGWVLIAVGGALAIGGTVAAVAAVSSRTAPSTPPVRGSLAPGAIALPLLP